MSDIKKGIRFSPTLCVTHSCNLDCIYCYQNHDGQHRMSFDTAMTRVLPVIRQTSESENKYL